MRRAMVKNLMWVGLGAIVALGVGLVATAQDTAPESAPEHAPPARIDRTFDDSDGTGGAADAGAPITDDTRQHPGKAPGTGGAGETVPGAPEPGQPRPTEEQPGPGSAAPETDETRAPAEAPHTEILMYGPNGLRPGEPIPESVQTTGDTADGGHTAIDLYGPNGAR